MEKRSRRRSLSLPLLAVFAVVLGVLVVLPMLATEAGAQTLESTTRPASAMPAPSASSPPPATVATTVPEGEGAEVMVPPVDTNFAPPQLTVPQISLLEAVRITLENDPNLKLQATSTDFQAGILQEENGTFDTALGGDASYEYTRSELTAAAIQGEIDKRNQLRTQANRANDRAVGLEASITELSTIRDRLADDDPNNDGIIVSPPSGPPDDPFSDQLARELRELQELLDLGEILINAAEPEDQARLRVLRASFVDQRIDLLQDQVDQLRETESEALTDLRQLGAVPTEQDSYLGRILVSFLQPFRSGVVLGADIELTGEGGNFVGKRRDPEFGGNGRNDTYRARVGFNVDLPLGRGGGYESAGARELAASIDLDASRAALEHSASRSVFSTAIAYWNLVAAQQRVAVFERSVVLQGRLGELTRALIDADELPRVELPRVDARVATLGATVESSRRAVHEARVALAQTIGVEVESIANAPLAADPFPAPTSRDAVEAIDDTMLARAATDRRYDLLSARQLEDSGKVLLEAARLDLRPLIDLTMGMSYASLAEDSGVEVGVGHALFGRFVGPSARLGLAVEKSIQNNVFEGRYVQAEALSRQDEISAGNLERTIKSNVVLVLGQLAETVEEIRENLAAERYSAQIYDAEVEKLRVASSTLIDTIQTEQRLTDARLGVIAAYQRYAQLIAQLRFESGTLVEHEDGASVVEGADLVTLPSQDEITAPMPVPGDDGTVSEEAPQAERQPATTTTPQAAGAR